jgi:myo-inositol catabolism protein IolC
MGKARPGWRSRHEDDPTLEEFFSAAALIVYGFRRGRRIHKRAASRWATAMGQHMALVARRHRNKERR